VSKEAEGGKNNLPSNIKGTSYHGCSDAQYALGPRNSLGWWARQDLTPRFTKLPH
jgi:hypothetical protein